MAEETLGQLLSREQIEAYEIAMRSSVRLEIVRRTMDGVPVSKEDVRKIKQVIWEAGVDYRGEIPTSPDTPETLPQMEEESRLVCT